MTVIALLVLPSTSNGAGTANACILSFLLMLRDLILRKC